MDSRAQALEKLKKKKQEKAAAAAKATVVEIPSDQGDGVPKPVENPINEPPAEMQIQTTGEAQEHILPSTEMLGVPQQTSPSKIETNPPEHPIIVEEGKSDSDDDDIFLTDIQKEKAAGKKKIPSKKRSATDAELDEGQLVPQKTRPRSTRGSQGGGTSTSTKPQASGQSKKAATCSEPKMARKLNIESVLTGDFDKWNALSEKDFLNTIHCMEASRRGSLLSTEKRFNDYKDKIAEEVARTKEVKAELKKLQKEFKKADADRVTSETNATTRISELETENDNLKNDVNLLKTQLESMKNSVKQAEEDRKYMDRLKSQVTDLELSLGASEQKLENRTTLVRNLREQLIIQRQSKRSVILSFLQSPFFDYNIAMLQAVNSAVSTTEFINKLEAAHPDLSMNDPVIQESYDATAQLSYNTLFDLLKNGGDLEVHEEVRAAEDSLNPLEEELFPVSAAELEVEEMEKQIEAAKKAEKMASKPTDPTASTSTTVATSSQT